MDSPGDHHVPPVRMTPCSLARGCHQSRCHSSSLLDDVLAEKKMAIMQSPDVIKWLKTFQLESLEQNNEDGPSWLQQQSRKENSTHRPNAEPESYGTTTEPESYQSTTEPDSFRFTTQPETYQSNAEPESYQSPTEPKSYQSIAEPESYRFTTEPIYQSTTGQEFYRPNIEQETYQPNTRQELQLNSMEKDYYVTALKPSHEYNGALPIKNTCIQDNIYRTGRSAATSSIGGATELESSTLPNTEKAILVKNTSHDQQNLKNIVNMETLVYRRGPDTTLPAVDPSSFLASCRNPTVPEAVDELQNICATSGERSFSYNLPVYTANGLGTYQSPFSTLLDAKLGPDQLMSTGPQQMINTGPDQQINTGTGQQMSTGLDQMTNTSSDQLISSEFLSPDSNHLVTQWLNANPLNNMNNPADNQL